VWRHTFEDDRPFQREFEGLQHFERISREHPSLLALFHIGRNDTEGYFYYVMEAGDDEVTGSKINPETYSPRNLTKDLKRRSKLPVTECVSLGLALTDALQFLHEQRLIHRDIKPANIIFVGGVPKLADIGLVTDIPGEGISVTAVGTPGYIAPELPGRPPADVYSLGKVLYEAATGLDRLKFPELPASITESGDGVQFIRLNSIIIKACEVNVQKRYQSAAELRAALLDLQRHLNAD